MILCDTNKYRSQQAGMTILYETAGKWYSAVCVVDYPSDDLNVSSTTEGVRNLIPSRAVEVEPNRICVGCTSIQWVNTMLKGLSCFLVPPLCEETARSSSSDARTLILTSLTPELRDINFSSLSMTQSVALYFSNTTHP